ncbi:hypothetical protein CH373_01085 [Leptospira perolatii]|uniref:Uncharacterized protein n=1 Tax=Leptospira perolatii TaxID=2023191 RepID=A0A2M9ZRH2_9LEPT|nr:hypothetical protein CH360_01085 [Leptospira perolatii]PJZ74676.1 hypothetical protein CH373_01085 [Leptospira perolatii]
MSQKSKNLNRRSPFQYGLESIGRSNPLLKLKVFSNNLLSRRSIIISTTNAQPIFALKILYTLARGNQTEVVYVFKEKTTSKTFSVNGTFRLKQFSD